MKAPITGFDSLIRAPPLAVKCVAFVMSFIPCCAIAIGGKSPIGETDFDNINNMLMISKPKTPT